MSRFVGCICVLRRFFFEWRWAPGCFGAFLGQVAGFVLVLSEPKWVAAGCTPLMLVHARTAVISQAVLGSRTGAFSAHSASTIGALSENHKPHKQAETHAPEPKKTQPPTRLRSVRADFFAKARCAAATLESWQSLGGEHLTVFLPTTHQRDVCRASSSRPLPRHARPTLAFVVLSVAGL